MLKPSRHREMLNAQTAVAQKVYAVVPMQEWWHVSQIMGELRRTGMNADHRIVQACLRALTDSGLVSCSGDKYQREPVQEPRAASREQDMPAEDAPPQINGKPAQRGADRVGLMTAKLRTVARHLTEAADEIDAAVIELLDDMQSTTEQTKRLQQLRDLLKEL